MVHSGRKPCYGPRVTKMEKGAWVLFFAQLGVMLYSASLGERPRNWLIGLCTGSGLGMLTATLIWWPLATTIRRRAHEERMRALKGKNSVIN